MEFQIGGCFGGIFEVGAVKSRQLRETSDAVEKDNAAWKILKPLYGASTVCKDRYNAIRDSLSNELGRYVTSLDKSVFFWTKHGFGYGGGFRDPNSPNLDKGILKVNGKFGAGEQRNAFGIIAIRVDDLLIRGGYFL